jgi:hypothetical protein
MPNKHKNPMLGWHPKSAELGAWVKAMAKRWGVPYSAIIEDAVAEYRTNHDPETKGEQK